MYYKSEEILDLMYLEVPLNAIARFDAGPGKFFIDARPYVGLGLSGKYKQTATSNISGGPERLLMKEISTSEMEKMNLKAWISDITD